MRMNVDYLREHYFEEISGNQALRGAPVYTLGAYSSYMTDLLWSELFATRLGGKILRLFTFSSKRRTLTGFSETYRDDRPESEADYLLTVVKSNYKYEDHGASRLIDRFNAIQEMRGGDADVPTALIYYFNPKSPMKYWLWISTPQRRVAGTYSVWGNVVVHFINDWVATRLPEDEPLRAECRLSRQRTDSEGRTRKWRRPVGLDLVACDSVDFLRGDYLDFQVALVKAHDSRAEDTIRASLGPLIAGADAETKLLFWRNEYYPALPEMPRFYNVRRYISPLEAFR